MNIQTLKKLTVNQSTQINQLWNDEYPEKLRDRFPILLEGVVNCNHYVIEDDQQNVIAWAVDFEKENEVRFSIIVSSLHKGKGVGTLLMEGLMQQHAVFYGWVIDHDNDLKMDGTTYQSPKGFYLKLGLTEMPECRIDNEMIQAVKMKWERN